MRVVVVEDDFIVADHFRMMLTKHGITVLKTVDSYESAMKTLKMRPDLYFVDIRLNGEKTGLDLAQVLHENSLGFIYVTANNELETMKTAVKTKPLAYITKPYKESDILALLEMFKSSNETTITVKSEFGKKMIPVSSVLYFESEGSYVKTVTSDGAYSERTSLTALEDTVSNDFIRIHRSYLVNKNHIKQFNSNSVYIANEPLPISRSYKKSFLSSIEMNMGSTENNA